MDTKEIYNLYNKVESGKASKEEEEYLLQEIENARKIIAHIESSTKKKHITEQEKKRKRNKILKIVLIPIISLLLIAAIVCGIIFIPSISSARKRDFVGRGDALAISREYLSEFSEDDISKYVVRDIDKELRIRGGLTDALFVYEIRLRSLDGTQYTIEVSTETGDAIVTDIDRHHPY